MKLVRTKEAVGSVLAHDITQIVPGVVKKPVFKKGHVVREEDIEILFNVGKENLFIWESEEGMLHEDQAAEMLRDVCLNTWMKASEASEGKIEITAMCSGLLKVNSALLREINSLGEMMIATRHGNTAVQKGDKLAGTRIIPLMIEQEKMQKMQEKCGKEKIMQLLPFQKKKAVVLTTGNEVYSGRIKNQFFPVIEDKLKEYDCEVVGHEILPDVSNLITQKIGEYIEKSDLVICTGGMSVDPDDKTPLAIKNTGAHIISYGAPVLPGAMFLLAYLQNKPVIGLPGCVMYAKRTIFDLVLARLMADDKITACELSALGEGGLCLNCEICTYPNCGFGKGK